MTAVRGATHATKTTSKKSQLVKRLLGKLFGKRAEELSFDTSDESSGAYKKSIESESSGYGVSYPCCVIRYRNLREAYCC